MKNNIFAGENVRRKLSESEPTVTDQREVIYRIEEFSE
jgi:hypothetical protein